MPSDDKLVHYTLVVLANAVCYFSLLNQLKLMSLNQMFVVNLRINKQICVDVSADRWFLKNHSLLSNNILQLLRISGRQIDTRSNIRLILIDA